LIYHLLNETLIKDFLLCKHIFIFFNCFNGLHFLQKILQKSMEILLVFFVSKNLFYKHNKWLPIQCSVEVFNGRPKFTI